MNQAQNSSLANQMNKSFPNVFPTIKRDGRTWVTLNVRELNECLPHLHFKMDSIKQVLQLTQSNCFS